MHANEDDVETVEDLEALLQSPTLIEDVIGGHIVSGLGHPGNRAMEASQGPEEYGGDFVRFQREGAFSCAHAIDGVDGHVE